MVLWSTFSVIYGKQDGTNFLDVERNTRNIHDCFRTADTIRRDILRLARVLFARVLYRTCERKLYMYTHTNYNVTALGEVNYFRSYRKPVKSAPGIKRVWLITLVVNTFISVSLITGRLL